MPRKEPFPYSHYIKKTRKYHICRLCKEIIVKGSSARYKNLFTGKKAYIHTICPKIKRPTQKELKDGIIELDSDFGKEFGFTADKFFGWLWKQSNFIWISFIESKYEGKGNLRKLFDTIEEKGFEIIVPTPSQRMQMICEKRGMKLQMIDSESGKLYIMK